MVPVWLDPKLGSVGLRSRGTKRYSVEMTPESKRWICNVRVEVVSQFTIGHGRWSTIYKVRFLIKELVYPNG